MIYCNLLSPVITDDGVRAIQALGVETLERPCAIIPYIFLARLRFS